MVGIYRVPNVAVLGGFGDIPHGALCHCWIFIVAVPGTRERNCEKIFLAIDTGRNYRRRPGNMHDIAVLSHPALLARRRCKKFRVQSAKFKGCVHHRWTALITWIPGTPRHGGHPGFPEGNDAYYRRGTKSPSLSEGVDAQRTGQW